jgi:copper transport protein
VDFFNELVSQKWIVISAIVGVFILSAFFVFEHGKNTPPQLQQTLYNFNNYSVIEFKLPDAKASPLFPVYDKTRNVIWVGDTKPNSGRIWEFELNSKRFVEHHVNGTNVITTSFLDSDGTLWYIDPEEKLLGHYDPSKNTNKLIKIPTNGTLSGMVVDLTDKVWITSPNLDEILQYDVQIDNFTTISTPTAHASPLAIDIDKKSGYIWIDEAIGQIAKLDPSNDKITEFKPPSGYSLKLPVAIKIDPNLGTIYIAEHGEDAIFEFYPVNDTFNRLALHPDPDALPYGMAFDRQGNIWIAQHTVNKIAVIDPGTGKSTEVTIPSANPLTQWITSDLEGDVWIAEPGGAALGVVAEG